MDKIAEVCKELGITQKELALKLGLHYTTFTKWKEAIPKSAEVTLDLLLENAKLKKELEALRASLQVLSDFAKKPPLSF